jgi:hypothetical protein
MPSGTGTITAEEIAIRTELRDSIAKSIAWVSGTTGTYSIHDFSNTATFDMANDTPPAKSDWTGDGYMGHWAEWATNNPSVTSGDLYWTYKTELEGANGITLDGAGRHEAELVLMNAALTEANTSLAEGIANAA